MKKKLAILLGVGIGAFLFGYGALTLAYPSPAPFGLSQYEGYYQNVTDTSGDFVLLNKYSDSPNGYSAINPATNTATEFINEISARLTSGNAWDKTGASFIIDTMIGTSRNRPPQAAQLTTWKNAVNAYAAAGRVNWNTTYCYTLNTYYQRDRNSPSSGTDDVAFFDDSGCGAAIVFTNPNGSHYAIRRQCANPLGILSPLVSLVPPADFAITGKTLVNNTTAVPGSTITFTYQLQNLGPTSTSPKTIAWTTRDSNSGTAIATGSAGVMAKGPLITQHTEAYKVPISAAPNTKICRRIDATPQTEAGGTYVGTPVCSTVPYNYDLKPTVTPTIKDINGNTITGNIAEPGDTVIFTFTVNNAGSTVSESTNCTIYGVTKNGFYAFSAPAYDQPSSVGYVPPPTTCPQTFAAGSNTTIATENVPAASVVFDKTLCRTFVVNPAVPAHTSATTEACVNVASKPYFGVRGGDISAGNPQTIAGACSAPVNAAIVGWNQENSPGFNGAGVQFAALAINNIFDVASAQGGGTAPAPRGLSFANNGAYSGGVFGGKFGSPDCIPDYYATLTNLPSGAMALPGSDIGALATGSYTKTGDITLTGTLGAGRRVVVYVKGNVLIASNPAASPGVGTVFPGSWTSASPPLFELVVQGNIYISKNVTQLDGLYVAQPNGGTGGTIFTCAQPTTPVLDIKTTDPTYGSQCNRSLTINGSFVANQVRLLRTSGTLSQNNTQAELFNYSPALWMAVPPNQPSSNTYDSITSLPPIL